MTVSSRRRFARAAALGVPMATALTLALAGCTQLVAGSAGPAPLPATAAVAAPVPAAAPVASPSDAIAEAAAASLQEFWASTFPAAFGREWDDVDIFAAVHTGNPGAPPPPCVNRAADIERQAFYCPAADAVAWDADGLLPALHERFGPAGVAVVLAHEVGHAVQTRLGVDDAQAREPDRYPTILLEAMADCYAGVAVAHFVRTAGRGGADRAPRPRRGRARARRVQRPARRRLGGPERTRQRVRPRLGVPGRIQFLHQWISAWRR